MREKRRRNLVNGASLNLAVKQFSPFGLELDVAVIQRNLPIALAIARVSENEVDTAVEEVDANVAPGDHFANVPLTVRLLVFHRGRDAVARRHRDVRKAGLIDIALLAVRLAAIGHPGGAIQHQLDRLRIAIRPGHAPPLADAFLHDVALHRSHPGAAPGAVRPDAPIKNAAVPVMPRTGPGRPFLLPPFVFHTDVNIVELVFRANRPVDTRMAGAPSDSITVNTPRESWLRPSGVWLPGGGAR